MTMPEMQQDYDPPEKRMRNYTYSSVYDALAEHILDGRLEEGYDHSALRDFLARTDESGGDPDWEAIDDALDRLTTRFKEVHSK